MFPRRRLINALQIKLSLFTSRSLGLSLPLMARIFKDARDMRRIFDPTKREDENVENSVDFSKDEEEDEEKKAAS